MCVWAPRGRTRARGDTHRALYFMTVRKRAGPPHARNTRIAPVPMSSVSVLNYAKVCYGTVWSTDGAVAPSEGWLAPAIHQPQRRCQTQLRQCNMDALAFQRSPGGGVDGV